LLRAQLLEEGYDVFAVDDWHALRQTLRPGAKPRLVIVDLQGLGQPMKVLNDLRILMDPDHVIVLAASGTVPAGEVAKLGYRVLTRPVSVRDVVTAAAEILGPPAAR
jgi:nucleoside-diphosphate-sugar epimerase